MAAGQAAADGDWLWHRPEGAPCRVVDRQDLWGSVAYRVWLPSRNAVLRAKEGDLAPLGEARHDAAAITHAAAAAKLLDAMETNLLLAPMQSSVTPLPHQLYALDRAVAGNRARFLLADEVGLGKTIEAGLVIRELKLRGRVKRVLVVAPKGLARQWQAEMLLHFNERFRFVEPSELAAFRQWRGEEDNLWRMEDQIICSLDAVKPIEGRKGWSLEQIANHNRERFEDLVSAGWDLVVIDEAHRLGGSTDQVARYKLGAALSDASPYLLLLSATPHQGKTDQFMRLMQLIDREAFPDEGSVHRDRVAPYVIRTEKRMAIDADGKPLFKPRSTRMLPVAWQDRHGRQRRLYESVTDYVRHGYNQAMASKQRHIGFLMILMQRLVTSSTAAIRATLERRLAILETPDPQGSLLLPDDPDDWADMDGQSQVEAAVRAGGSAMERSEVEALLALAVETEAAGTDAKAEALLETIYKIQQEENDPAIKVLIFTEFVPTQAMLASFLESRGFSVATLNGSMDLDARTRAQRSFASDTRVLVSTDAGGEGLNLQFCHVIVNFDMPWNPMRIEQRIGRVDRIGQTSTVRAINLVLEDTVEHRVRQVLEEKLEIISKEFGIDKAADVMDSAEAEPIFDELFLAGINDPDAIGAKADEVATHLRSALEEARRNRGLLADDHDLDAAAAKKWRDHPAQYWLQRAILSGIAARGGSAERSGDAWRLKWADGSETPQATFDAKASEASPAMEWITLEDPRARAVIAELPRHVRGQPVPEASIPGLPPAVSGVWSLWEIGLVSDSLGRKRYLPVFAADDGRSLAPTARRVWDLLLTETAAVSGSCDPGESARLFDLSAAAVRSQGERVFSDLLEDRKAAVADERRRAEYAFEARGRAVDRVGLQTVRDHRRKRLERERADRMASLDDAASATPDLAAVAMLRIGPANTP